MAAPNRAGLQQAIAMLAAAKKIAELEPAAAEEEDNALSNAIVNIEDAIGGIAWVRTRRMQPSLGMNIVKPHERSSKCPQQP